MRARLTRQALVCFAALAGAGAVGCGSTDEDETLPPKQALKRSPYMGVSCRTPNSFKCDRVGLAVWLRESAVSVDAAIAGQKLTLDDRSWSGETGARRTRFAGFLQPAGLIDGPLKLTGEDGRYRWYGADPVAAMVDLRIVRADGIDETTELEVDLSPGWG